MAIVARLDPDEWILYEVLRHPSLFGEFVYNVDQIEVLNTPNEFKLTGYQNEMLCDFNDHVSFCTARAVGKSTCISLMDIWALINKIFPNDYILYTVPSKVHLEPVFANLTHLFRNNSFLQNFIEPKGGINNSDFKITLLNGSVLLCRIAGQTGTGANVIGLHTPFVQCDEGGYYNWNTFQELQPVLNTWTDGYREIVAGVPTGLRENNVLYHVDIENSNYTKHRASADDNPRLTIEDRQRAIEQYRGEDSEDFEHLWNGHHGKPVFALFDRSLFEIETYPVYKLKIDGIRVNELSEYLAKFNLLPSIPDKSCDSIIGVDLGYCYSADTDVLTKRGWLKHKDIAIVDLVACYSTTKNEIVWEHPLYTWEQNYKGKMLHISGKSTDFLVSPEHSVWINKYVKSNPTFYEELKAKQLVELKNNKFNVRIAAPSKKQVGPSTFNVPYYYCNRKDRRNKNTEVKMSLWLQFLGWFISEGSATANRSWEVDITQSAGEYSDIIDNMFNQLPFTVNRKEFITQCGKKQINWEITCKELCLWLRDNCGIHSENKKIPSFVFDCSTEDQELFLRTLLMGDGSRVNDTERSPQYNSQSRILVDQIQRLAISLGYSSTMGLYKGMYKCSIMNRQENMLCRDNNIKEIDYDGKIYCLKTNTGFYVTRRNGKVAIQGNTDPTCIVILYLDHYRRIKFHARIELTKVSYPIQEKLIDILYGKYGPSIIAIDKGSAGISVIQNLLEHKDYIHRDYHKIIFPIDYSSSLVLGTDSDGNEIKSKTKPFAVTVLQDYSNNHRLIYSSTDYEMITELERMTYSKTPTGEIVYKTLTVHGGKRGEDHFTSALLCATTAYYLNNEFVLGKREKKRLMLPSWI